MSVVPLAPRRRLALHEMRSDTGVSRYLYNEPPSPSELVNAVLAAEFQSRLPPAGPGI
jgi:hypothetical protein